MEWKHISALFRAYPWEYQPEIVVQDIRSHSVPSSFQQVLTRYEKILAITIWSKICVFGEHNKCFGAFFRRMSDIHSLIILKCVTSSYKHGLRPLLQTCMTNGINAKIGMKLIIMLNKNKTVTWMTHTLARCYKFSHE